MDNLDLLYLDKCLVTFRYEDGSEVQCVITLNLDILKNLALDNVDGFVDLLSRKIVPFELFNEVNDVIIEEYREPTLSLLDSTFQEAIKRKWNDV